MSSLYRLLPTTVRTEHLRTEEARMLSLEICRRGGTELRPDDRVALAQWLDRLHDANEVLEYRPETRRGWWRVLRVPEDLDIVRTRPPPLPGVRPSRP